MKRDRLLKQALKHHEDIDDDDDDVKYLFIFDIDNL